MTRSTKSNATTSRHVRSSVRSALYAGITTTTFLPAIIVGILATASPTEASQVRQHPACGFVRGILTDDGLELLPRGSRPAPSSTARPPDRSVTPNPQDEVGPPRGAAVSPRPHGRDAPASCPGWLALRGAKGSTGRLSRIRGWRLPACQRSSSASPRPFLDCASAGSRRMAVSNC